MPDLRITELPAVLSATSTDTLIVVTDRDWETILY